MTEHTYGCATIVNDNSLIDMKKQSPKSWTLVILDPPFGVLEFHIEHLKKWLDQAERICLDGGNIVSVNYPDVNRDVYSYLKSNFKSLTLKDTIIAMQGSASKQKFGLCKRQLSIDVYCKGAVTDRKYYHSIPKLGHYLYAPEKEGVLTDMWTYKQHYPCRKGLHGEVLHIGAMAKWVVNNILHCYARPGDKVYDAFGGAGTFPAICRVNNIECRSIEINPTYFELMKKEVRSDSKFRTLRIIDAFVQSTEKLNDNKSKTIDFLGRGVHGCADDSELEF